MATIKRLALTGAQLRWLVVVCVSVVMALGLVLLFLLAQAADNRELYEQNYQLLVGLNLVVAATLLLVIVWLTARLVVRLRRGKFGSRLLIKLAATFALVGFVPGLLIYGVSYQFVARSIESWFDVKVEGALDAGLNLGRVSIDNLSHDMSQKAKVAAAQLPFVSESALVFVLDKLREQIGADDMVYLNTSGTVLASSGGAKFSLNPYHPSALQLRQLRQQGVISWIEGLEDVEQQPNAKATIQVMVWVSQSGLSLESQGRVLWVSKEIPQSLVANALAVESAYREYQERALGREGLRSMYIGTLTLTLFLSMFGAVLLAVLLGNQLARPLLLLAEGVRDVASGDLRPKPVLQGRDELEGLTRSFAQMTEQLLEAREALGKSMEQVNTSRANLQTILDHLTSGVLLLREDGGVRHVNPGACRILGVTEAQLEDMKFEECEPLQGFAARISEEFERFEKERDGQPSDISADKTYWEASFELHSESSSLISGLMTNQQVTLLARGAIMPNHARLVVFDDISAIVSAQRSRAWAEVARRLAHEIKNPLTPIQLSAERLEMKLTGKLEPVEQSILVRSVKTIVEQVAAMQRLVNEFRDYARLPLADLKPIDLNELVKDIMQLYGGENALVPIQVNLCDDGHRVLGDAQQLRQVIHNLLQNAQDATVGQAKPWVEISTQWQETASRVRLVVRDNGSGFSQQLMQRAFEPYVTTKSKGTGLGLAVVKKIVEDHHARIDIKNREEAGAVIGAQVSLSFDTVQTNSVS